MNHSYWSYVHQLRYPTGASHCRYHGSPAVRRQQLAAARGALAPALRRFSLRGAATQRAATGRKQDPVGSMLRAMEWSY